MKTLLFLILLCSLGTLRAENAFVVMVTPPEKALDWNSPGSFVRTLIFSRISGEKRPYGTVVSILSCQPEAQEYFVAEPQSLDVMAPLLILGQGLGYLFATHTGNANGKPDMPELRKNPNTRSLTFYISKAHCERIQKYLQELIKNKILNKWGLPHRPLMGEGANSASLAVSILKVSGLLTDAEFMEWEKVLYLPRDISGAPLLDQYVNIFSLLNGSWGKHTDEQSTVLKFYDPNLIHSWIGGKERTLDRKLKPIPEGSFWEQANDPIYTKKKKENQIP